MFRLYAKLAAAYKGFAKQRPPPICRNEAWEPLGDLAASAAMRKQSCYAKLDFTILFSFKILICIQNWWCHSRFFVFIRDIFVYIITWIRIKKWIELDTEEFAQRITPEKLLKQSTYVSFVEKGHALALCSFSRTDFSYYGLNAAQCKNIMVLLGAGQQSIQP